MSEPTVAIAPSRVWSIYALKDPDSGEVRYIGFTWNFNRRMVGHRADARRGVSRPVCIWILDLLNRGLNPTAEVIETGNTGPPSEREKYWIRHYRSLGLPLLNLTVGGEQAPAIRSHYGIGSKAFWEGMTLEAREEFIKRAVDFDKRGTKVIIDGQCASACTLYTADQNVCVTDNTILGFHAVTENAGTIEHPERGKINREDTLQAFSVYPLGVQEWLLTQGGLTWDMKWLHAPEVFKYLPKCS